ncbi:response regulator [Dyadobacter tibetensis]|uniref:response regulator n=1 Tax=Dyadobacter tibetensis TaxID=1211851 RepID=UPI0004700BC1|nr:response regulator [Dyadobacter tibetensis]
MLKLPVLVVEDDTIFTMLLKKLIHKSQLAENTSTFTDPVEARNHVCQGIDQQIPVVIFLDINMPILSGWQFLEEIKAYRNPSNTWVYITSSSIDHSDQSQASNNPFVIDYLEKPISLESILTLKINLQKKLKELSS